MLERTGSTFAGIKYFGRVGWDLRLKGVAWSIGCLNICWCTSRRLPPSDICSSKVGVTLLWDKYILIMWCLGIGDLILRFTLRARSWETLVASVQFLLRLFTVIFESLLFLCLRMNRKKTNLNPKRVIIHNVLSAENLLLCINTKPCGNYTQCGGLRPHHKSLFSWMFLRAYRLPLSYYRLCIYLYVLEVSKR